jgi:hypothetical protein
MLCTCYYYYHQQQQQQLSFVGRTYYLIPISNYVTVTVLNQTRSSVGLTSGPELDEEDCGKFVTYNLKNKLRRHVYNC